MEPVLAGHKPLFRETAGVVPNTAVLVFTVLGWLGSFALMGATSVLANVAGVLLCTQAMVLAAYLVHEAAHSTLFAAPAANARVGEAMSFVAGSSYAAFERIRHLHIRHHRDRADLVCFDFKALMDRRPALRRTLEALEWAYVPATEILMHLQVVWRPFFVAGQACHRRRALAMLGVRGVLLLALALWSAKALVLYALSYLLLLHVLNFFDAFHHTFEQHVVAPDEALPLGGRDRAYEQDNTYTNLVSVRWPWLNLLTLNFGYHNAHHERASVPWYRLPAAHRELFGDGSPAVMPLGALLATWHRNRVRRVHAQDYGVAVPGRLAPDAFVGTHGVSFLTVV
jgi:fatty acid desaturase